MYQACPALCAGKRSGPATGFGTDRDQARNRNSVAGNGHLLAFLTSPGSADSATLASCTLTTFGAIAGQPSPVQTYARVRPVSNRSISSPCSQGSCRLADHNPATLPPYCGDPGNARRQWPPGQQGRICGALAGQPQAEAGDCIRCMAMPDVDDQRRYAAPGGKVSHRIRIACPVVHRKQR